jgi:hypothetical protein
LQVCAWVVLRRMVELENGTQVVSVIEFVLCDQLGAS